VGTIPIPISEGFNDAVNAVFHKIKEDLEKPIEGIGCPAHILHNTFSRASGILSVDVEVIVLKIFNYFEIYTIRTEKLKEFCSFVDINHQTLLSHLRTRWLSLMPAVERNFGHRSKIFLTRKKECLKLFQIFLKVRLMKFISCFCIPT
jgi:hypothetical protein